MSIISGSITAQAGSAVDYRVLRLIQQAPVRVARTILPIMGNIVSIS